MPIYEYECLCCGLKFEKLVRNDLEAPVCPRCGSGCPKKLVSQFNWHFHGPLS